MIKIRRRRPLQMRMALAAALAAGCVGAMALPSVAGAADIPQCGGKVELTDEIPGIEDGGLSYRFNCNSQVQGFAIVSNRQVDFFGTEVLVLDAASGEATPEQFSCEGPFPSSGFGCRGIANFGNTIAGEFAIPRDPCAVTKVRADKFKVWMVATVTSYDSLTNKPFVAVTPPFRLRGPDCAGATKQKKSVRKGKRR